jgi:hypothetical protein
LREVDPRLAELAERVKGKAERKWAEDGENGDGADGEGNEQGEDGTYNAYCGAYEPLSYASKCGVAHRVNADLPVDAFHFGVSNLAKSIR